MSDLSVPGAPEDLITRYPEGLLSTLCEHCDRTIITADDGRQPLYWVHQGVDGHLWRGCRAASYDPSKPYDQAYDPNLARSWMATPPGPRSKRLRRPPSPPTMAEALTPGMARLWEEVNGADDGQVCITVHRAPVARRLARWKLVTVIPVSDNSQDVIVVRRHDAPDLATTPARCQVCDKQPPRRGPTGAYLTCTECHAAGHTGQR